MNPQVILTLDILGTVAFAASGVLAAMKEKLDFFGIIIIAFVTAIGGGTLRDVLIGAFPVSWIQHISYTVIICFTTFIVIAFNQILNNFQKTLNLFDSIGLGFFTIVGVEKGMLFDLHPVICIVMGTVTACFGGVIRDILINQVPLIFRKNIYASACLLGGGCLWVMNYFNLGKIWSEIACIILVVLVRMLAIKYDWQLPNIYGQKQIKREEEP